MNDKFANILLSADFDWRLIRAQAYPARWKRHDGPAVASAPKALPQKPARGDSVRMKEINRKIKKKHKRET